MRRLQVALFFLGILPVLNPRVSGQSIQSLGFSDPAVTEIVFPQVPFGDTPDGRIVSEIVVSNPGDTSVDVAATLFDSDGRIPSLTVERGEPNANGEVEVGPIIATYDFRIEAGAVMVLNYPYPPYEKLHAPPFAGWTRVRSSGPVSAYIRIQVYDPVNLKVASEIIVPGSSRPIVSAEFPAVLNEIATSVRATGIAIVNPYDNKEIKINVELLDFQRQTVQQGQIALAGGNHRGFTVGQFFGRGNSGGGWFVRLTPATPGDTFACMASDYSFSSSPFASSRKLVVFVPLRANDIITGEPLIRVQTLDKSWNLPNQVTRGFRLGDLQAFFTAVAFFVLADDGTRLGPFRAPSPEPSAFLDDADGIAVFAGHAGNTAVTGIPILFSRQRKVVYEPMHGVVERIVRLPDSGLLEIKTNGTVSIGLTALVSSWILVDADKAEVVARFSAGAGVLPQWRK